MQNSWLKIIPDICRSWVISVKWGALSVQNWLGQSETALCGNPHFRAKRSILVAIIAKKHLCMVVHYTDTTIKSRLAHEQGSWSLRPDSQGHISHPILPFLTMPTPVLEENRQVLLLVWSKTHVFWARTATHRILFPPTWGLAWREIARLD